MKFFWKIFFAFTVLITVVFSIFGIWAISQAFQTSFDKEVEESGRENRMFQYAFEMNMISLPESYRREEIFAQLMMKITDNLDQKTYIYTVFDQEGREVFSSREPGTELLANDILGMLSKEKNCGYEVVSSPDSQILYYMCRSQVEDSVFYLESCKDITEIYKERDEFYSAYRIIMVMLLILAAVIIFVMSHILTKSIVALSDTTRKFSEGDYQIRADDSGEDEIGMLSRNFNRMADNLVEKMDELTDAVRKQEDFTASFAHELKTPLTSIIGYSDMLRTMDMDREETMEASNYIYSQGKRLEKLSLKLLELIVVGKQELHCRSVQVAELLEEVGNVVTHGLEKQGAKLHIEAEDGVIWGERDLLISLLVNLVDNSRKALSEDGNVWIKGRKTDEGYELTVKDNGRGMPKEEIHKITEAFYMVDKSRSRKEGGVGLGMTLCSRIVEVHRARWTIESRERQGTEVRIVFSEERGMADEE